MTRISWAIIAAALVAGTAMAQEPARTADDYVCLLSGDCGTPPPARQRSANRFALATAPRAVPAPVDLRLSFAAGSATLTPSAQAEGRVIAAALARPSLAGRRMRIEGHTDSAGGRAANLALSQRRANAMAAYLFAHGVARSRLVAIGYGYDRPLAATPASSPANRRVVAVLLP